MKKTSARLGAGTLALATVVAGISFGPAAANAATSPEFQLIWKSGATFYTNVYSTKASDGSKSDLQSFSTIEAARTAGAQLTYDSTTKQIKGPNGTCLVTATTTAPLVRDFWLSSCGTANNFKWSFDADGTLRSDHWGATVAPGGTYATYGVTRGKLVTGSTWDTAASLYSLAGTVVATDVNARTADLSGTAHPRATVIINDTIPVPVGEDGKWSYTITGLKLGKNDIKLEQYEGDNNKTGETSVVADLAVAPITANAVFLTDTSKPLTISGTAQAGADVEIWNGTTKLVNVPTADVTGAYTADIPAPNAGGMQTYTVKQVLQGETAPDVKTVTADFGAQVSITSPVNDQIHDGGALRFQGRGVAGGTVELRERGKQGVIGSAPVLANGIWTLDTTLTGKKATYVATLTGKGNNVTTASVTLNPDGDVNPPVVNPVTPGSNHLIGSGGTPGATIIVRDEDGNEIGRDTVDENGNWDVTVPPTLGPGEHDLEIVEQNDGQESDPTKVTVDFGAAVVATTAVANAQGIVTYTGTGASGATVEVKGKSGRVLAGPVTVVDGKWTAVSTVNLPAGGYMVDAFQTTGIGVKSSSEIAFQVAPSTSAPVTFTGPANGSTAYTSKPTFSGKGQPGAKVEVGGTSRVIATTTVNAQGDWSVVSPIDLINGSYALQARQTPANGAAQTIATNAFQVDASPAAPVVVTGPADGAAVDGPRPVFSGTGAKGATITVKGSVKAIATTTVDGNGNWSVPAGIDLGKGGYVLTVAQKALNGAESDTTVKFTVK